MADIEFKVSKREGKTLVWTAKPLSSPAISGPYGNGYLPNGSYVAKRAKLLDKTEDSYKDPKGHAWMQVLEDAHDRTELGIHPDGGVVGTEGCIGPRSENTKPWYDAFYGVAGTVSLEVKDA